MIKKILTIVLFACLSITNAQELSPIKALRAEENYSSLLTNDSLRNKSFLNQLKAIPFNKT